MSAASVENRDSLSFRELLAWAWSETPPVHTNRTNLIIHSLAVPLFVIGHFLLLAAVAFSWWLAVVGLLCIIISLTFQGVGHSLEQRQVHPFT